MSHVLKKGLSMPKHEKKQHGAVKKAEKTKPVSSAAERGAVVLWR